MKLTDSQEQFIRNNKNELKDIFNVWMEICKDDLCNEEDNVKAAVLRRFIKELKIFSTTMRFINKKEKKNKIDNI